MVIREQREQLYPANALNMSAIQNISPDVSDLALGVLVLTVLLLWLWLHMQSFSRKIVNIRLFKNRHVNTCGVSGSVYNKLLFYYFNQSFTFGVNRVEQCGKLLSSDKLS